MNLDHLRELVSLYLLKECHFHYRGGRGTDDKFVGKIIKLFPRVFLVETKHGYLKCFSYSDFLVKTLKIY